MVRIHIRPACFVVITSWLVIFLAGCKKFTVIDSPADRIQTSELFTNDETATSAVTGLYYRVGSGLFPCNGAELLCGSLSSDELVTTSLNTSFDPFRLNSLTADNNILSGNLWKPAYNFIYQINAAIEQLTISASVTESFKNQLLGEMYFMRALCYFYLVNFFGDVPLVTVTDYTITAQRGRDPVEDVYAQILSDLTTAAQVLPVAYPSANRARPNHYTALSLLARVYLYLQNWPKAAAAASEVIASGLYKLEEDPAAVFQLNSGETIFQLAKDNGNTGIGIYLIPFFASFKPSYAITDTLYQAFELGDARKDRWIKTVTIGGKEYHYPFKYTSRLLTPVTEYYIELRLAEQYLIRAEARAELNDLTGAAADLNKVRERSQLPAVQTTNQDSLQTAIFHERQTELFCEGGHRWLDLKRSGMASLVLGKLKGANWQSTDLLYPIPIEELRRNPHLVQNPGY
jgi:hypothetical protein